MRSAPHSRFFHPTDPVDLAVDAALPVVRCEGLPTHPDQPPAPGGLWDDALFAASADGWAQLVLPLPVLHPFMADRLEQGAVPGLALARGEAWWQDGQIVLPPGRSWTDGRQDPLWAWPPRLRWPPPSPSAPDWADQQLTLALSPEERTGWQAAALEETGHRGLLHLPPGVLTHAVPIPPPALRPLQVRPGGQRLPGPDSLALAALVRQCSRLQRVLELGAPEQVIRAEHRNLQLSFEAAVAVFGGQVPAAAPHTGWQPAGAPPTQPPAVLPDPLASRGCAFLPDGSVLLAMGYATVHLRPQDGAILGTWASPGLRLLGCLSSESGEVVALYDRAADWGVHLYHLSLGRWLQRAPQAAARLALPVLSPGEQRCLSACGRFVWTRPGAVVGTDGLPVALPWWSTSTATAAGAQALALTAGAAWMFVDGEMLYRAGSAPCVLGAGVQAAALDATGERLFVVRQGQAMLYSLEAMGEPHLLVGLDLRWLRALLGSSEPDPVLRAALCQYGTLSALAQAADLADAVRIGDPLRGYRRPTLPEVTHLRRLTTSSVARLPLLSLQRSVA